MVSRSIHRVVTNFPSQGFAGVGSAEKTKQKRLFVKEKLKTMRILVVEDDSLRVEKIKSWVPSDIIISNVTDAGVAMAQIKADRGWIYAGIMLDHDLEKQLKVASSARLTGSELINIIIHYIDKNVPVLVHSMNPGMAPVMVRRLESAGFDVTRIPMTELTKEKFNDWVEFVRECWEDSLE